MQAPFVTREGRRIRLSSTINTRIKGASSFDWVLNVKGRFQLAGGGLMKRVGSAATLSLWGWCWAATVALGDKTGKDCTAAAGALPCDEMQTVQRLELPDLMGCVWVASSTPKTKISSMQVSAIQRRRQLTLRVMCMMRTTSYLSANIAQSAALTAH